MKRVTVADAPAILDTHEKAFWAIGWNACAEAIEADRVSRDVPETPERDAIAVNLLRHAGIDKHKARECADLVLLMLAASTQPQPVQRGEVAWLDDWSPAPQPQPVAQPVQTGWTKALEIRTEQGWDLKGTAVPVLYTDSINGEQVCRDDVWLCTTAALEKTQPVQQWTTGCIECGGVLGHTRMCSQFSGYTNKPANQQKE